MDFELEGGRREEGREGWKLRTDFKQGGREGKEKGEGETRVDFELEGGRESEDGFQARGREGGGVRRRERGKPGWILSWREGGRGGK